MKTTIPLYTYPTDGSWASVLAAHTAHPNLGIVVVINPDSGSVEMWAGAVNPDPNYQVWVKRLQAAGIMVLGYCGTANIDSANIDRRSVFFIVKVDTGGDTISIVFSNLTTTQLGKVKEFI